MPKWWRPISIPTRMFQPMHKQHMQNAFSHTFFQSAGGRCTPEFHPGQQSYSFMESTKALKMASWRWLSVSSLGARSPVRVAQKIKYLPVYCILPNWRQSPMWWNTFPNNTIRDKADVNHWDRRRTQGLSHLWSEHCAWMLELPLGNCAGSIP